MQNHSLKVQSFPWHSIASVPHLDELNCIPYIPSRLYQMPIDFTNMKLVTLIHKVWVIKNYKSQHFWHKQINPALCVFLL